MKTIFITISRGSVIRNFFHTGIVAKLLQAGLRVVVLTPYAGHPELFAQFRHENLIIEPLRQSRIRFNRFLSEISKGSIFNDTVYARYHLRFSGDVPQKIFFLPRMLFCAPLRFIPGIKKSIRFLDDLVNRQTENDYLFARYRPDLVFLTSAGDYHEAGLIKGARRFKAQTVVMPKSWDNLSKILFPGKSDFMLVWNRLMREHALKYQDYRPEEVIETGAPQFDFYHRKDLLETREDFCRRLGLDPAKKIILYSSCGRNVPHEAVYLELIKSYLDQGLLGSAQVLIRPHVGYVNDAAKFDAVKDHHSFVIDKSDKQNDILKDHWDISPGHAANLYNSLHHAALSVNIASTLAIDSIACGTPIIKINFDPDKNIGFQESVTRFYKAAYMRPLLDNGSTQVANSEAEFLSHLQKLLSAPAKDIPNYREFEEYFLFQNDGQASARIVEFLLKQTRQ